jgi:hypothetical protein
MLKRIAVVLGIMFVLSGAAWAGTRVLNFDADNVGGIPKGFTNESGEWRVVPDSTAPSPSHVLAQLAKNSGSAYNLILYAGESPEDVDVSVSMKAVAGDEDRGGGIVWRARDANNYYIVRFNPLEDNFRLYRVVNGKREQLKSTDIRHADGWHTLRVAMLGNRIECYYDNRKYLDAADDTFKGAGKVGLWTKADAQTYFDDFSVASPR